MFGYKFRCDIERDIDNSLAKNRLYVPDRDRLNDPTEIYFDDSEFQDFLNKHSTYSKPVRELYNSLIDFCKSKCGIFSLSKNVDNELLWAYYADGHRGFCIEYDIERILESYNYGLIYKNKRLESWPLIHLIDVIYQNKFSLFTSATLKKYKESNNMTEILKCIVGTKSGNWEKENEVRLIFNKFDYTELDYRAVTGIYFGCRFDNSSNEIERIMYLLKGRGIKYYRMKFINNSYILGYEEIKDKYHHTPKYVANNLPYDNIPCLSTPEIIKPNKDIIEKALKFVSQEPCINKIKSSYITLSPAPMIAIETYTNPDFNVFPIKTFRFDINLVDRTIKLRRFQLN